MPLVLFSMSWRCALNLSCTPEFARSRWSRTGPDESDLTPIWLYASTMAPPVGGVLTFAREARRYKGSRPMSGGDRHPGPPAQGSADERGGLTLAGVTS